MDVTRDAAHCGSCDVACAVGEECSAGACEPTCASPRTDCGGACVDLLDDVAHCGACGHACAAHEVCDAGTCGAAQSRIGWVAPLGDIAPGMSDFLLGTHITVSAPTTLRAFGIIAHDAGHEFRMALYRDRAGIPTELVASTGVLSTSIGAEEHSVDSTSIAPGVYWLVAIYAVDTRVGWLFTGDWGDGDVAVRSHAFSDPLPALFEPSYFQGGYRMNYWIVVSP